MLNTLSSAAMLAAMMSCPVAALAFQSQAQETGPAANGWTLYRTQDTDGRLQFSLGYMEPIERRFLLTFTCTAHSDEVIVVYYPPPSTVADNRSHEVRMVSDGNSDTFYGPYSDAQGQVVIFGVDGKSTEQIGLLRSGFVIAVDDVLTARVHTIEEQAAIVEELIAGCWS